jgi:hypothetical protein
MNAENKRSGEFIDLGELVRVKAEHLGAGLKGKVFVLVGSDGEVAIGEKQFEVIKRFCKK